MRDEVTAEDVRSAFFYDECTGIFTVKYKYARQIIVGTVAGSKNPIGYIMITLMGRRYMGHRLAWLYVYGEWPKKNIDHINGVRDDNRIVNLRDVTTAENAQNMHKRRLGASGFHGVVKRPNGTFSAQILADKKFYFLGVYDKAEDASDAYKKAKQKLHVEGAPK